MTKIINLDDLKKPSPITIVTGGKKHEMQTVTVEGFLANMQAIDSLGVNATPAQEVEVMVSIILRAFPTLKDAQVRGWTLDQLRGLSDLARGGNDEIASTDEEEMTEAAQSGNDQAAG